MTNHKNLCKKHCILIHFFITPASTRVFVSNFFQKGTYCFICFKPYSHHSIIWGIVDLSIKKWTINFGISTVINIYSFKKCLKIKSVNGHQRGRFEWTKQSYHINLKEFFNITVITHECHIRNPNNLAVSSRVCSGFQQSFASLALCEGFWWSAVTGGFLSDRASNVKSVYMSQCIRESAMMPSSGLPYSCLLISLWSYNHHCQLWLSLVCITKTSSPGVTIEKDLCSSYPIKDELMTYIWFMFESLRN